VLLLQPDVGQTFLLCTLCVAMLSLPAALLLDGGVGCGRSRSRTIAYFIHPHVRERIAQFLDSAHGYQTGLALKAFEAGGITGVGPAPAPSVPDPDAHTDFILPWRVRNSASRFAS